MQGRARANKSWDYLGGRRGLLNTKTFGILPSAGSRAAVVFPDAYSTSLSSCAALRTHMDSSTVPVLFIYALWFT